MTDNLFCVFIAPFKCTSKSREDEPNGKTISSNSKSMEEQNCKHVYKVYTVLSLLSAHGTYVSHFRWAL